MNLHSNKPKNRDFLGVRSYAGLSNFYNSEPKHIPMKKPDVTPVNHFDSPQEKTEAVKKIKEELAVGGTLIAPAPKAKRIKISSIETNDARQPRVKIDNEHVGSLREKLENGVTLDPIIVFSINGEAPFFLSDGWHRLKANKLLSFKEIDAEICEGGEFEAFKASLGANDDHGLPRTNADKNNAVTLAFGDERLKDLSDNFIAEICKVSQPFVSKLRTQLITVINSAKNGESKPDSAKKTAKTGKDGKSYQPKKEKTEPAAKEILDDNGILVPEHLHAAWRDERATEQDLRMHALVLLERWPAKMYGELSENQKQVLKSLLGALAIVVCPACKGEKCKECHKRGIISKHPLLGTAK